jgi:hypothetical protein
VCPQIFSVELPDPQAVVRFPSKTFQNSECVLQAEMTLWQLRAIFGNGGKNFL